LNKWLKIGIPILVAVLVLAIGAGVVLAKEKDISILNGPVASYDNDYSRCRQCTGLQYSNCPCAGNGGGWQGYADNGYCPGPGACYGPGGWSGDNDTSYQPPCHRYWR
jgi:hypothetical protein